LISLFFSRVFSPVAVGVFILNNYKQAAVIIRDALPSLALYYRETGHTADDLDRFILEEQNYMLAPQEEPPQLQEQIDYIDSLRLLDDAM
jgi:hypothetical protein